MRHRRQLVAELKVLRQRLHEQLNALCPGLSAPAGHGRALDLLRPTGRAVLACAAAFAGRAASARSLLARAPGRLTPNNAEYWAGRWRDCLGPVDADLRAQRLRFDLERLDALLAALAATDRQLATLLADTNGQVLTSLPGVAVVRAALSGSRSLGTPAASATPSFATKSPTTRGAIVAAGAGGDGAQRYAVRRRNLACRPPARPAARNGDNESLPHDGA